MSAQPTPSTPFFDEDVALATRVFGDVTESEAQEEILTRLGLLLAAEKIFDQLLRP